MTALQDYLRSQIQYVGIDVEALTRSLSVEELPYATMRLALWNEVRKIRRLRQDARRKKVASLLTIWMGKRSSEGRLLTPKPVRLYWDPVFGNWWASKGPGDHAEGYDRLGVQKVGPFGKRVSLVSLSRHEVDDWLKDPRTWLSA